MVWDGINKKIGETEQVQFGVTRTKTRLFDGSGEKQGPIVWMIDVPSQSAVAHGCVYLVAIEKRKTMKKNDKGTVHVTRTITTVLVRLFLPLSLYCTMHLT